ncbi:hypothetical protein FKW77_001936 [Venturia effusa]|uniref:BTB domain-containing protein n=1 Tax=Venturia effusa TaxID=50376 RepID=A0A517L2T2_9PEZI|nr:hypothetical protein FKW77_001936 [Venturia effusa]
MPPNKQLPTPSANTPGPQGVKRKRGETEKDLTKPQHCTTSGESLITGRATEFAVGDKKFSIHDTLAKANSPYLADLLEGTKEEIVIKMSIPSLARLFKYFHSWLYEKDGCFLYRPYDWYHAETQHGYPFIPLIRLYMLAHELRVPAFANAVLQKTMEVLKKTGQVCDASTVNLLYKQQLQSLPIHSLFVDMVAFNVHKDDILECENLEFLKAVAHCLVEIRDDSRQRPSQPISKTYFITTISNPEPEPEPQAMDEEDDDDCVIISSQPAANPGRTSRAPTVKREQAADVEA